jgi:ElaB/YqjD/DUF883 family membrane-anchored ribosome-binding protein
MAGNEQFGAGYGATDYPDQVAEAARGVAETVTEISTTAGENMKRVMQDATNSFQRTADYFRNNDLQKISGDLRDYARANPAQALVGAAVAGFLLGRMISRR